MEPIAIHLQTDDFMDEIAIWNKDSNTAEIKALMNMRRQWK